MPTDFKIKSNAHLLSWTKTRANTTHGVTIGAIIPHSHHRDRWTLGRFAYRLCPTPLAKYMTKAKAEASSSVFSATAVRYSPPPRDSSRKRFLEYQSLDFHAHVSCMSPTCALHGGNIKKYQTLHFQDVLQIVLCSFRLHPAWGRVYAHLG